MSIVFTFLQIIIRELEVNLKELVLDQVGWQCKYIQLYSLVHLDTYLLLKMDEVHMIFVLS